LTPGATTRPFETLYYTEAGLLGHLRPQDMKLMVASFPGVFGTPEADTLRAFCLAHRIPLAWAINRGETWTKSMSSWKQWLPFAPVSVPVGPDRLLDPVSLLITNASMPLLPTWKQLWEDLFKELQAWRHDTTKAEPQPADYQGYWARLAKLGGGVQPLRGGECHSTELCFGTYRNSEGTTDCLCKRDSPPAQVEALATAPIHPTMEFVASVSVGATTVQMDIVV